MYNKWVQLIAITATSLFISSCKGQIFKIPSGSMSNTLEIGDEILVTKSSSFSRNDIAVFNYFGNDYRSIPDENGNYQQSWAKVVFRLIAFSGDKVEIRRGELYLNGKVVSLPSKGIQAYHVYSLKPIDDFPDKEYYRSEVVGQLGDTIQYLAYLTHEQSLAYMNRKDVVKVERDLLPFDPILKLLISPCPSCRWSVDDFGPLVIPSIGETVKVDSFNYPLYKNIPGIKYGENTITEPLYFLMGDNRHGAMDSRFIGYIPHSNMYGIVK